MEPGPSSAAVDEPLYAAAHADASVLACRAPVRERGADAGTPAARAPRPLRRPPCA